MQRSKRIKRALEKIAEKEALSMAQCEKCAAGPCYILNSCIIKEPKQCPYGSPHWVK